MTLRKRIQQLRTGSPFPIILVHHLKTPHYRQIEKSLHYKFAAKRVSGEWFALTEDDVTYIKSLNSSGVTPEEQKRRDQEWERQQAEWEAENQSETDRQLAVLLSGVASGAGLCLEYE